jgi:transcriptional regulator with XRE-family HTH domain
MTPAQCRMARAALELGVRELAEAARVSTNTVTRFEKGDLLKDRTIADIRAALESAGVEFIAENGGGAGVRLKVRTIRPGARVKYRDGVSSPGLRNVGAVGEVLDRVAKLRGEVVVRWPSGEEAEAVADKLEVVD